MSRHEHLLAAAITGGFISSWLAYTFLLPPFEGFDETGHYSYVSLLADEAEIPDFRSSPMDGTIARDFGAAPRPYAGQAPFENNGGLTYAAFFGPDQREKVATAAQQLWTASTRPARYTAGTELNWQGQHPPLFYLLMTAPYRLSTGLAPGYRLLVLRLVCVGFASGSLLFWYLTLRAAAGTPARRILLGAGGAVLLLPSHGYDLGRLGNDSLAALLLSASVFFAFRAVQHGRLRDYSGLAVALGGGLLTKAFFVPVTAGLIVYFAVAALQQRTPARVAGTVLLIVAPLLISGWWFAKYAERYGHPLGSHETYVFAQSVPVGRTLDATAFAVAAVRGTMEFVATFTWCGSWSWVRRPNWQYTVMAPLLLAAAGTLARNALLRRRKGCEETRALGWIAAAVLGPVLLGFAYHLWLRIWHTGSGSGNPGYYLFFAWPLVGLCLAGIWELASGRASRLALLSMVAAAMIFEASGFWFSAQLYTGLVVKTGIRNIGVGGVPPTLENLWQVHQRLSLLSFPTPAFLCYALSFLLRLYAFGRLAMPVEARSPVVQAPPDAIAGTRGMSGEADLLGWRSGEEILRSRNGDPAERVQR